MNLENYIYDKLLKLCLQNQFYFNELKILNSALLDFILGKHSENSPPR
jgi:hypothetical protein